ncbi:hypothetical protein Verru16b_02016 [Lacunisphaera limnophila]|uniref:Uncharacterized protein n=1 Tax=Lacunisphaera limnophila TaxID=1838286 RepID=A0A1D8AVM7_9BACT|nr:hypothetical protein [Lacunisphaera limnophila]AOS44947.1 hypothetical protein Verru16b_02016 [Lacunisphaera limnophila]
MISPPITLGQGLWTAAWLGLAVSAGAVERTLTIEAPAAVAPGADCPVVLAAGTDAGQGERIGMFQADFSVDGGRTWTGLVYLNNIEPATRQERVITAGPAGTSVQVRLRVAFRDGLAGDVDYTGAALRWNGSWGKWAEPPAKLVTVLVR